MASQYILYGLWIVCAIGSTIAVIHIYLSLRPARSPVRLPNVVVIAPIKNGGPLLDDFLRRLRSQNYPAARIVVAIESESDPAHAIARSHEAGAGLPMRTITAGISGNVGQKIENLLAALKTLTDSDEIVVFADADALPHQEWLLRLVLPIIERKAEAVSGYRWLAPHGEKWAAYWVAATNNAIASLPRSRFWNAAWGGSFAIRRDLLDRIEIGSWWRGAVSDDLQMTRALWSHGIRIVQSPGGFVPTPVDCGLAEALEFGRRQYLLVRTHLLYYWTAAAIFVLAPLAFLMVTLSLALRGDAAALATLAIVFALAQIRAFLRSRIGSWVSRDGSLSRFRPSPIRIWLAAFTHPIFHALCLAMAFSSRRIRWAGIEYEIRAPQRVQRFQ